MNRYSKLVLLQHGSVRLVYTIMVGDVPAYEFLRAADQNRDGQIDAAEERGLALSLRRTAEAGLHLELDGRAAGPAFEEPVIGLTGRSVAPAAFSVDLAAVMSVPGGATHELRLDDQTTLTPVGEVEVLIEESPGVTLLSAYQGGEDRGGSLKQTRFLSYGPPRSMLADRSVHVRFGESQPSSIARGAPEHRLEKITRRPWLPAALGGLVVAVIAALGARLRAQRRMKG